MEKSNSKTIGNVLSLIGKQSLKSKINSDNKYNISFKNIRDTNYSYINELPYIVIKCNLKFIKTKYSNNVPFLTDIQFPGIFYDLYKEVCDKYFENENYLENTDDTFGSKKDGLIMFAKIKCKNDDLIHSGNGSYKLTLQFGSILNKNKYKGVFKINFYIKDFEKLNNECLINVIDEFEEDDIEYLP